MRAMRLAVIFFLCATFANAQGSATGRPPFGSFQDGQFDSVNLYNLNVNFSINPISVPGRGLSFNFSFVYDSSVWKKVNVGGTSYVWQPVTDWGWKRDSPAGTVTYTKTWEYVCDRTHPVLQEPIPQYSWVYANYAYTERNGTRHTFSVNEVSPWPSNCDDPPPPPSPRTETAKDGSGFYLDATSLSSPKVYNRAGDQTTYALDIFDTNGNYLTRTTQPSGDIHWTDTTGRLVLRIVTVSSTRREYHVKDTSGTDRMFVETLETVSVSSGFGCSGVQEYSGNATRIQKIELPQVGTFTPTYQFTYDTKGRVSQVSLPTGGSINYTHGPIQCTDGSVQSLMRTVQPDNAAWDYTRTLVGSIWKTTVKAPSLSYDTPAGVRNETVLEFTNGLETKRQVYQGPATGNPLLTVNSTYTTIGTGSVPGTRVTVLPNDLQSKVAFTFDSFTESGATKTRGLIKELKEYDYGSGAPPATHTRKTTFSYLHETNSAYVTKKIFDRASQIQVFDGPGTKKAEMLVEYDQGTIQAASGAPQHDYTNYPPTFTTRGNPTKVRRWISGTTYADTVMTYDELGNVRAATDAGNHQTTFSYADSWGGPACSLPPGTLAYLKQITNHLNQTTEIKYYQCTGQIYSVQDPNDIANSRSGTVFTYADPLSRLTQTDFADTGQITIVYNDSARTVQTTQKRTSTESVSVTEQFDQLGRLTQRQLPGGRKVDIIYSPLGEVWKTSNPYITTSDATYGLVETRLDGLGRVKAIIRQDGSSTTQLEYSSNETRVTDESAKRRLALSDGLGRVTKVCEVIAANARSAPASCGFAGFTENGYIASNTYDVLDNITRIVQGTGTQQETRTMAYDGLGRITSAIIPEVSASTSVTYGYDLDSNRTSVTDPRSTVNFEYDALHRLFRKKHGTTTVAEYTYDGTAANNAIGRLITDTDGIAGSGADKSDYTYDALGRILTANRTVSGTPYTIGYQYDLMGNLTQLNYPSGRVVTYSYNSAAELTQVRDATSGPGFDYVTGATYSALGTLQQLNLANQVSTTLGWNNLARLTSILTQKSGGPTLLSLGYSHYANGQIQQIVNALVPDGTKDEKYSYDALGRLLTAQRGPDTNIQRKYEYDYDRFGNRWGQNVVAGSGFPGSNSFDYASNRVTSPNFSYDNSGNITANGAGTSYTFNPENFITAAGASITYTVDTLGRRTKKTVSGVTRDYFYSGTLVISEKQGTTWTDYIFFADQRIVQQSGSTLSAAKFLHTDHLKSTRVCTDGSGNSLGSCDYEPFGEFTSPTACSALPTSFRFAGMQYESETGQYYTSFRQYDPNQGRWMSVDPLAGSSLDPRSLDRYTYVMNDPVDLVDPEGLDPECGEGCRANYAYRGDHKRGPFIGCSCGGGGSLQDVFPCKVTYVNNIYMGNSCHGKISGFERPGRDDRPGGPTIGPPSQPPADQPQPCVPPSRLQSFGIKVQGWLASITGKMIGVGAGGSGAIGRRGLGVAGGVSRQVVVSPNGQAAFATSYSFNSVGLPGPTFGGAGAVGGLQISWSNAQNPSDIGGPFLQATGSLAPAGFGLAGGVDAAVAGSIYLITITGGAGAGGKGGAGLVSITSITPICSQ